MNKKTPEEIAKELESIDFAEIDEGDLKDIFGSLESATADCNCPIINDGCIPEY